MIQRHSYLIHARCASPLSSALVGIVHVVRGMRKSLSSGPLQRSGDEDGNLMFFFFDRLFFCWEEKIEGRQQLVRY